MTDILLTGNIGLLKNNLLDYLAEDFRVVIAGKEKSPFKNKKGIRYYRTAASDKIFRQLFDVYSFNTVFFVSGFADGGEGMYGEIQELEKTLLQCAHEHVNKVVVLSSIESINYVPSIGKNGMEIEKNYYRSLSLKAGQIEQLCAFFNRRTSLKTIILRLPYLAGRRNDTNYLGRVFGRVYNGEKLILPYREEDSIDFIGQQDLADLLQRIINEEDDESGAYYVCSGYDYTYGDLADVLNSIDEDVNIRFENMADVITRKEYPFELRRIYGWIPKENILEELGYLYEVYITEVAKRSLTLGQRLEKLFGRAGGILQYAEMLLFFLFVELLNNYMSVSVYFKFVDLRLFFIVIMGTVYGIKMGILAALLECVALLLQYLKMGVDWTLLFYNVENWIPFMIYLMAGSVVGYIKSKKTEEINFSRQEYSLLHDKYLFLNEVYQGAIENKGEYKKQILGFKDSFGRIFDAVQKLDNILPQSIFLEALGVMEDILENHSIAIYSVDQYERFGRLVVCSNAVRNVLQKSMELEEHKEMFLEIKEGRVWKNLDMKEGEAVYSNGVFRDNRLVLFVVIYEANPEQYGMNYMNIFRILCGLIQTSFLRALDYDELAEEKIYYHATNVMRPERFQEIWKVQEEMREKGIADYVLLHLQEKDRQNVSNRLSKIIRSADIIGEGADGSIYLLLTQVSRENFRFVEKRLLSTGLTYELTDKIG